MDKDVYYGCEQKPLYEQPQGFILSLKKNKKKLMICYRKSLVHLIRYQHANRHKIALL